MNIINHISIFGLIILYFYSVYIYLTIKVDEDPGPYWAPLLMALGFFVISESFGWLTYFAFFY